MSLGLTGLVGVAFGVSGSLLTWVSMGLYAKPGLNFVLWSLMLEEVLYASMPFMAACRAYEKRWPVWLALALSLLLSLLLRSQSLLPSGSSAAIANALPCFWVGNLAYIYRDRLGQLKHLAIASLFVSLLSWSSGLSWDFWLGPLITPILFAFGLVVVVLTGGHHVHQSLICLTPFMLSTRYWAFGSMNITGHGRFFPSPCWHAA